MNTTQRTALSLLIALAGAARGAAQDSMPAVPAGTETAEQPSDQDPRAIEIIRNAQAALAEAKTLSFSVVKTMEKTDELAPENAIFATITIGAKGKVQAARDDDGRWVYRIDGTADDIGRKDAFEIVILRATSTVSWLDQERSELVLANTSLARGRELSTEPEFGVDYIFGKRSRKPFENLLSAPSLEVLEPQVIDEVLCDVVRVGFGKPNGSGDKVLYIGSVDGLPRRVHDALVTGFENRYVFSMLDAEEAPTVDTLAIEAPEGWGLAFRPESLRNGPSQAREEPRASTPAVEGEGMVGFEVGARAPAFRSTTLLGEEITSDVLQDSPTVLVFWASWLPGAIDLVEYMGELNQNDSYKLVTFAVRERSPDAAFNMLAEAGLESVPLLIDTRDAAMAYGITRAPVVFVVDSEGVIRYRSVTGTVEELVVGVNEAVENLEAGG